MRRPVVVDTNVLVSGLLTSDPSSPLAVIVDGMLRALFPFLVSSRLVAEYRDVLLRPRIQRLHGLTDAEVEVLLTEIAIVALWRDPPDGERAVAAPDPGDQHLWDLLHTADGAILVTGDALLSLNPPSFAAVMTPRAFVALLGGEEAD